MYFDVALNALWLMLGIVAIGMALRAGKWLIVVRAAVIVAALFPYISASDDVLRFDHDQAQHRNGSSKAQSDNLMRLYATMDTPVAVETARLTASFVFVAFLFFVALSGTDRSVPQRSGRSPPQLAAAP